MVALTRHAANRMLEREIPYEAVEACRKVAPILNENPLRFRFKDLVIVACKDEDTPRIISVWRNDED
jgi:hypothetical protein